MYCANELCGHNFHCHFWWKKDYWSTNNNFITEFWDNNVLDKSQFIYFHRKTALDFRHRNKCILGIFAYKII